MFVFFGIVSLVMIITATQMDSVNDFMMVTIVIYGIALMIFAGYEILL